MPIPKVYVSDETITLICPHCGAAHKEQAGQYKNRKDPLKIHCACQKDYEVQLEFRKTFRKRTNLDGIYVKSTPAGAWGKIVVRNVSMGGCGFETMTPHALQPGDAIKVEFTLDNGKNSQIKKNAVVRVIEKRYIGCQFICLPGTFEPELGFYMKSD